LLIDEEPTRRDGMILALAVSALLLVATVLVMLWLRENCDSCNRAAVTTVVATTTTAAPTTTTTEPPTTTTTEAPTTTTTSIPLVTVGEFCVTGVRAGEALNVRSGPGAASQVIGTFPYSAVGILGTGSAQADADGRVWFEVAFEGAFTGRAWVASWLLTEAPCGPYVDFTVVLAGDEIDFDPGEWDPVGQSTACGAGGDCFVNRTSEDRERLPLASDAEVYLIGRDASALPAITPAQFAQYLDGDLYDPAIHLYEASYQCTTTCAEGPRYGQPYHLLIEGGVVVRIEQVYTP
jgi:hypothetical protein